MRRIRPYSLGLAFLGVHSLLVAYVWWAAHTSGDPVGSMFWTLFEFIDWPSTAPLFPTGSDDARFVLELLVLGGMRWTLLGLLVQWISREFLCWLQASE